MGISNKSLDFNSPSRYNILIMMIYTSTPKSKRRKTTAKQRELQSSWEQLLKKYPVKQIAKTKPTYMPEKAFVRETPKYPSLDTGLGTATKPINDQKVYTGTAIKGIGTMHKSNAVPIFSDDAAIDIARMRR
jgi:hypothetical protein